MEECYKQDSVVPNGAKFVYSFIQKDSRHNATVYKRAGMREKVKQRK